MPAYIQPQTLFSNCVTSCIGLINSTCNNIDKTLPKNDLKSRVRLAKTVRQHLLLKIPPSLLDAISAERGNISYNGDGRIQFHILTHPDIKVYRKCFHDHNLPAKTYMDSFRDFKKLVVLDLKAICTDEILRVVANNCPLIEELNIMSKVEIVKSKLNAAVLVNRVSDKGLSYVRKLTRLRFITMDSPRNPRAIMLGRKVTEAGILSLLLACPTIEELLVKSSPIYSSIFTSNSSIGPLHLTKLYCDPSNVDDINKVIQVCPYLYDLSLYVQAKNNLDDILDQISSSSWRLTRINAYINSSITKSVENLLLVKGRNLTHLSLWEGDSNITFNELIAIGLVCPNLVDFCFMTQSADLGTPANVVIPKDIYKKLTVLVLGTKNFDMGRVLSLFLHCTDTLEKIITKHEDEGNLDEYLTDHVNKGRLKNITYLWLGHCLSLSKRLVEQLIHCCEKLNLIKIHCTEDMTDLKSHIINNNIDLDLLDYN